MATLEGSIERITYRSEETGYTVARLQPSGKRHLVTVVGKLLGVQVGESLRLEGEWTSHPEHGRQFAAAGWQSVLPTDVEGIRKYLGSGLIKGIGPVMAERIVKTFGAETLRVIEGDPRRLSEVPGLGGKKIDSILKAWNEQQGIKALMALLQSRGITPSLAIRIYRQYGEAAISIIDTSPYRLADEVVGVGFTTADQVALGQGVRHDDPFRIGAGLRHALHEAAADGHCYLPAEQLVDRATRLLDVDPSLVEATLRNSDAAGEVHLDEVDGERHVYLLPFYRAELGVANAIRSIQVTPSAIAPRFKRLAWRQYWDGLARRQGQELTPKQREAVQVALTTKFCVLTGGPGTGKTTTLRTVIDLLDAQKCRYVLASPTGRAAKRLSEATGAEAKTIHRLLEYSPIGDSRFKRTRDNPLEADIVVVDETSMLDIFLCNDLLKAVPPSAHVLFVGDVDQLPSVGPGNVLRDLIDSWAVPAIHLDRIFRQAEDSEIIENAHRINSGEMPRWDDNPRAFFFSSRPEPAACAERVVELVTTRIRRGFRLGPRAIQVLSPTHRGPAGVQALNQALQAALNPPHPGRAERAWGDTVFRTGDRVMQVRNNYDLDVYNGDIGEIRAVDADTQTLTVGYEEADGLHEVVYDWAYLDELQLAYATSIHKAQGAEYPAVVVPLLPQHAILLQRNLLYTAVTRAKQLVVLVGDERAVKTAVRNNEVAARFTGLKRRLRSEV
ncbi:MAG: RecD-like DNA helicase YrrC [uncultured Chloroflexia bacterium]|uniref:ATP-dependent RecD2 DNA helicase n=1 Tax=uncultured Chloroflexia bacterium TaxID=1672391 RepID=A0A6J4JHT4_9CHLR|nr:MAG: RecD-like DNA helicase YrrC [uncultured Chloroflexia bacterium]